MKKIFIISIVVLSSLLGACGPKPGVLKVSEKVASGDALFLKAEQMFKAKAYPSALVAYNAYVQRYPDGSLAAEALMKIAAIHTALGDFDKARDIYQRLISEYPQSPYVADARVDILSTFYNQGRYAEVIEQAAAALKVAVSRTQIVRTNIVLGDTYMAVGSPIDAVTYYAQAHQKAMGPEKDKIIAKLKEAVGQLDSAGIEFLLSRIQDKTVAGYLMYQLGSNLLDAEDYESAVKVLSSYITHFSQHENVPQAQTLLEEIHKKSVYSRYTLGCLLPLSGRYQIYGRHALRGVELALNRFTAQGGRPALKIIVKDTGSDPDDALAAVQELSKENVAAIIGPLVTAESAAKEAQKSMIPIITLTQKDDITKVGDYVFRNFITPQTQVKTMVSFVVKTLGLDSFAILYPDDNYGKTFMNLFWDEVLVLGGRIVGAESYSSTYTDFADPIKKITGLYYDVPEDLKDILPLPLGKEMEFGPAAEYLSREFTSLKEENSPDAEAEKNMQSEGHEEPQPIIDFDAVFIPDAPQKAGLIIPQLAFYDVRGTYLLGTNLWHSKSMIEMSRQHVQGAIMTDGFFAQSASPRVREFTKVFKETYGEEPGFIEAVAYDTAMILLEMVSRPEIRFRSTLKKELSQLKDYEGITGRTSFDAQGEVSKKLYLLQIKKDGFVEIGN